MRHLHSQTDNSGYTSEFNVGNMLPQTPLTGSDTVKKDDGIKNIDDMLCNDDKEILSWEDDYIEDNIIHDDVKQEREGNYMVNELYDYFFCEADNNGNKIPDKIEGIVKTIEGKGYSVKYSSPGYSNTTFSNDRDKDGVVNAKMRATARIIFARDYKFNTTPQGWKWVILKNDSKALYVKPYTYNEKMGSEKEAFKKWQEFYLSNIATWADELPEVGKADEAQNKKDAKPDTDFAAS